MNRSVYQSMHEGILARPALCRAVVRWAKILPGIVYGTYPLLLISLWLWDRGSLLRAVLVPAAGFFIVTVLRAAINAPRPYEVLGIPPLISKETVGKSLPSRHAACAAVIAMAALKTVPPLGIFLWIVALAIGISRVLTGVHFLRDVILGLLLGGAVGFIGMFLL